MKTGIRHVPAVIIFCLCTNLASPLGAQAVTIMAVRAALESAIAELRSTLDQTTHDFIGLGNSVQANAQSVLADIDRIFGDRLDQTFDHLEGFELRLVEDAQGLTSLVHQSASLLAAEAGDEARRTLIDADILAYNTSFSLPCRTSRPRVIATSPDRITVSRDTPVVSLRGNFLNQGVNMTAKIDDKDVRIIERHDTSIRVEIPRSHVQEIVDDELISSLVIDGLKVVERSLGLLGCSEREREAQPLRAAIILEPPVHYAVIGTLVTTHLVSTEVPEAPQSFANTGSDKCDDHYRVDRQWCISGEGTVDRAEVQVHSKNCRSSYEGWVPSGDKCVLVRGTVGGCGAIRGPFRTWLGCKGRGWLRYSITLVKRVDERVEAGVSEVSKVGDTGERSFSFAFPRGQRNPQFLYEVAVEKRQGNRVLERAALSHANPVFGTISSRATNGTLSVEVQ